MNAQPRVLLALSPPSEQAIEELLFADGSAVNIVASALQGADVHRLAAQHRPDVVLLSPDLPGLSAADCTHLRTSGVRLVGLALDDTAAAVLGTLGVDAMVGNEVDADELRLALARGDQGDERAVVEPQGTARRAMHERGDRSGGCLLAVVGSKGAPGASECAISLAALAQERWPAALVECDLLGGGLDLRLTADGREGSLRGLVRACAAADGAVGELLERWLVRRPGWPPVLLAPPDPEEPLGELAEPGVIAAALHAFAAVVPLVICDVGFLLEEAGEATPLARCHREAIACADAVLLVIGARDRQVRDGLAQLDLLRVELEIPTRRLRVVCTGLGAPGTSSRRNVIQMLSEQLAERDLTLDGLLPFDERALRRAERRGLPLATARRHGGYAHSSRRLLDQLLLPASVARPRERKLRLLVAQRADASAEEVPVPWQSS